MPLSSCGTGRNRAGGRVQAVALGDVERTMSGKTMRATIWCTLRGTTLWCTSSSSSMPAIFPARAGSTACHVSGGGDPCLVSKWSVNVRGVHLNEGVELIAQELLVFSRGHAFQQLE